MGVYFDKEIQQGAHPLVSIEFMDPEVGFGVFSMQRIPSCAYVGEYTGVVKARTRKYVRNKVYCVRYGAWKLGGKKFIIDAEKQGNFTRFINHSFNPNLSLQSVYWRGMFRMIFIALREIEEGEQLTFNYGPLFWKESRQIPKNLSAYIAS
jgi:SET domain-containing protein